MRPPVQFRRRKVRFYIDNIVNKGVPQLPQFLRPFFVGRTYETQELSEPHAGPCLGVRMSQLAESIDGCEDE